MANMTLNGWTFDINPNEASWTYKLLTNSIDTYGGRVIQILACRVEGLTVRGYITQRGSKNRQWADMEMFEDKVKAIMDYHAKNKAPVSFSFPALNWRGQVFLTGYSDVTYDPSISAVSYTLMFNVDSGFDNVLQAGAVEKAALENIKSGINWVRSEYNTPPESAWKDVLDALKKAVENSGQYGLEERKSLYDYISELNEGKSESASDSGDDKTQSKKADEKPNNILDGAMQAAAGFGSWLSSLISPAK